MGKSVLKGRGGPKDWGGSPPTGHPLPPRIRLPASMVCGITVLQTQFSTGSVVNKAKMTYRAPTKLLVSRMLHETVQVAHHY